MVIVIDDHSDTRRLLMVILKLEGFPTVGFESGSEGLAFLADNTPKLVILDYSMPDMSGLDVLRTMRADPRLKTIPVIMFSAHDGVLEKQARAAGVDAYIRKGSLDWAALRKEIHRVVGKGKPKRDPADPSEDLRIA